MKPLTGWGRLAVMAAVLATGGLYSAARTARPRGPATRPNPAARPPEVSRTAGVLRVMTQEPAELVVVDTTGPQVENRLLFFAGRATSLTPRGVVTLDGTGAPVAFDRRLHAERLHFWLEGRQLASITWDGRDGYWIATREGSVLRVGWDGVVRDSAIPPFAFSFLAADPLGRAWAVRSPEQFAFPFGVPVPPLLVPVGHGDSLPVAARLPRVPIFVDLVNAGRVAFGPDGSAYYTPFIRDEIVKLSLTGDTLWVASRGLPHGTEEPRFEVENGKPVLDYAPVNLGIALGPDGMLYVLSTPGFTTEQSRLDVLDPDSGIVRRTVELPTALPTLAVDARGRVYLLDQLALLTGVAPRTREAFREFDLERMGGGRLTLADFRDRVLLVNFWASWCAPCRVEMPTLDSLRRAFPSDEFAFLAVSDDISRPAAERFIRARGFDFPVALGLGKMRARYHYFGLPHTVLVDREGRVVEQWSGFAGERQIAAIRALVWAELGRGSPEPAGADAPRTTHAH